jgi:hypothetical protein
MLFVAVILYRRVLPKFQGPKAVVRGLLRRYHLFERTGLPERESLYRILTSRRGWRNLPQAFLVDLIARLKSKENVFRFVSLAEGYRYERKELPAIARKENLDDAMKEIVAWLSDFGDRLRHENRLKEAEFVQKLGLELLPDQSSTMLQLAATYYKMERYGDAAPLFKEGLARLKKSSDNASPRKQSTPSSNGSGCVVDVNESTPTYEEMYTECLKAARSQREATS